MPMRFSRFLTVSLIFCVTASLYSQMTPIAPIKNFRLPRFGDNGYTQWMLQGEQGIYRKGRASKRQTNGNAYLLWRRTHGLRAFDG